MRLEKIKEMSGKRKRAWLKAIDELKKKYKKVEPLSEFCPLCQVVNHTGCGDCLWTIIEGCSCSDYKWGDDHVEIPETWMEKYFKEWKIHRFKMLDVWKKIITIYILIDSMEKMFKDLGQDFKKIAEKLRPLGEAIKKMNEAAERQKIVNKKGVNHRK